MFWCKNFADAARDLLLPIRPRSIVIENSALRILRALCVVAHMKDIFFRGDFPDVPFAVAPRWLLDGATRRFVESYT